MSHWYNMRKSISTILASALATVSILPVFAGKQVEDEDAMPQSPDPAALTSALAPAKKDPDLYYKAGCKMLAEHKLQQALNLFNKALELNPNFYEASCKKALVYQLTGYDKFAARRYQDVIKHRPDMDQARINLAALHHKHKHYSGAEEQYKAVISHNFYSFEAHYNLANVLLDDSKPEEALKEYKICLKLQPKNALVHNNMGVIFLQKKYVEDALLEFKRANALAPADQTFSRNISVANKMLAERSKKPLTM